MTILASAQNVAALIKISSPSALVGSSNDDLVFLKALFEKVAQDLRDDYPWPELQKEYTFTLATSTSAYSLPGDFHRLHNETLWNRSQHWPLLGPLTPMEWQQVKSGNISSFPRQRFRIKGWSSTQFVIDPTPTSSENGQTIAFEYISRSCIRPKTWTTATSFAAGTYCSYEGNIYYTSAGGTTGGSAPVHTSGTASDGTVSWVYQTGSFDSIVKDTDEFILDPQIIEAGVIWQYKREKGLEYEELKEEWLQSLEISKTRLQGASIVSLRSEGLQYPTLGIANYPQGSF